MTGALDHNAIARQLRTAQATGTPCAPLRTTYSSMTADDAYRIQQINTDDAVHGGSRVIGRKIGLTAQAVQRQLGVDQPDFGTLFAGMGYGDCEDIPSERFLQPKVEAEIAFVLGRDLDARELCMSDVVRAIDFALPAIEIVDSRIAGWDIKFVDTVADNASCGAFVVGSRPCALHEIDLRLCGMVIERRGEPVSVGAGAACLGNPLNAVLWLARKMAALQTPLRAGDFVLSGALGPMVAAAAGDVFEARISGLGSVRAVFSPPAGDA